MRSRDAKTPKERPKGPGSSGSDQSGDREDQAVLAQTRVATEGSRQFWPGGNAKSIRMIGDAVIAKECSCIAGWF